MAKQKIATSPVDDEVKMTVISIKMTTRFRDWLADLAESERITTVQLLEKAAVEFAERKQFPRPTPKRTEGR